MKAGNAALYGLMLIALCVGGNALLNPTKTATTTAAAGAADIEPRGIWASTSSSNTPRARETVTPSMVPTETLDRFADLRGTQTAVELSEIQLHQAETEQALQIISDGTTSTAVAQITSTAIMAAVNTSAASTAIANADSTGTQQAAGTQTAVPLTVTSMAMTQQVENTRLIMKQVQIIAIPSLLGLALLVAIILGWLYGRKKIAAKFLQESQIVPDDKGRYPAVPEDAIPGKSKRIVNTNLAHRAVIDPDDDDLTPEQALANTQAQRELESVRTLADSPALRQLLRTPKPAPQSPEMPNANMQISQPIAGLLGDNQIVAPPWSLLNNWDGQGAIPYGVSARGLERVNLQNNPHLGIFGKTGQGKSRYFLRPFIACLLASGQRVVIIGKSGDFWPFADHPNAKMITLRDMTDVGEAQRYADYLLRLVKEKNRRDEFLTTHRVSTWQEAGREITFLVLDELGNALDEMNAKSREEAHRWVNALVREGRKVGLYIALASQRAVGFKSIVEQMGRVAFYLSDADASRYAIGIPGAEQLPEGSGHFLAKFGRINHCVSFSPTDEELTQFLQSRSVKQLEPIDWIEGEEVAQAGSMSTTAPEEDNDPKSELKQRIINAYLEYVSRSEKPNWNAIERTIYGEIKGGNRHNLIKKIVADYEGDDITTTTKITTTTQKTPNSSPAAA